MATYMQAVNITLPNAAVLHIQGTLSMAIDEVGWVFTSYIAASVVIMPMTRWLAGHYGRKLIYQTFDRRLRPRPGAGHACDDPDPVRPRPDRPRRCERHTRSAIAGDPARCAAATAACPHRLGVERLLILGIASGASIGGWLSEYHGWRSIFYVSLPMAGFIFLAVGAVT